MRDRLDQGKDQAEQGSDSQRGGADGDDLDRAGFAITHAALGYAVWRYRAKNGERASS